jgi:hypothetical protein
MPDRQPRTYDAIVDVAYCYVRRGPFGDRLAAPLVALSDSASGALSRSA